MTTYVYETIPTKQGEKPVLFEIKQSMKDAALTTHPESGVPVRRVLSGGFGYMSKGGSPSKASSSGHSCGCSPGGCCG